MYVAIGILVAGVLLGVGYLIKRTISTGIALGQAIETARQDAEHLEAMERAAADGRARRTQEFDAKASSVRDAAGAAELLRDSTRK